MLSEILCVCVCIQFYTYADRYIYRINFPNWVCWSKGKCILILIDIAKTPSYGSCIILYFYQQCMKVPVFQHSMTVRPGPRTLPYRTLFWPLGDSWGQGHALSLWAYINRWWLHLAQGLWFASSGLPPPYVSLNKIVWLCLLFELIGNMVLFSTIMTHPCFCR